MLSTRNKTRLALNLLVAMLAFSAIGCSSSSNTATAPADNRNAAGEHKDNLQPKQGGTITIGYQTEPDTLDPQKTAMSAGNFVSGFLGGALLALDPNTFELKPHLAESYTISEDGKTWTFKLRSGVKFHDGTPLTAASFKSSYERALSPETASPVTGTDLAPIKSISAPDDSTLILHLEQPSAPLLGALSYAGYAQPLSMEALKKFGNEIGRNPVGVGPWKFESWKTGESITLVRNDDYRWAVPYAENQGAVRPDKLVIKFIRDNQTLAAALDSGSIDIAAVQPKDVKKYMNNSKFTVLEGMQPIEVFIAMNLENESLKDINVRKALNLAINKEAIIQANLQGEGMPVYGPIPPTMFGYDLNVEKYGYKYNVEEAVKLLEASGWQANAQGIREKAGKTLSLTMITDNANPGNQLIQSMLKAIGIEVKIQNLEAGAANDQAVHGDFDLMVTDHGSVDPDILYLLMDSKQIGGLNFSRINDKQLDVLLEKGQTTTDRAERQKVYEQIQRLVVDQAYWVPLYSAKTFQVVNNRIQGVKPNPLATLNVQDMWVNE